jgi:hypothetical protein
LISFAAARLPRHESRPFSGVYAILVAALTTPFVREIPIPAEASFALGCGEICVWELIATCAVHSFKGDASVMSRN